MIKPGFKPTVLLLATFLTASVFYSQIIPIRDISSVAFAQGNPAPNVPDKLKKAYKSLEDLTNFGEGDGSNEEDKLCKSHLFGTTSQETCVPTCPMPGTNSKVVQTHKAANNPGLTEDVDCYGCAAALTCYDFGYMYQWPDCWVCEMDPKKVCVNAITFPGVGGLPGGGVIPLPTDPTGRQ